MLRVLKIPAFMMMLVIGCAEAGAQVELPALFADHMVLQREIAIPIWGRASAGEKVTVTLAGQSVSAAADDQGKWRVNLAPLPANAQGMELTIAGESTITFRDVLIGDVWICSGQSNMQFALKDSHNAAEALPTADIPQIRMFQAGFAVATTPQETLQGRWSVSTPQTAGEFSAVGWFFARDIHAAQDVPVGLIGVHQGASVLHAWTRLEALQAQPELNHYTSEYETYIQELPARIKEFDEVLRPRWHTQYLAWEKADREARARNEKTDVPKPGKRPEHPLRMHQLPTVLYNAKIAPLVPFGIKGVLWYQGETGSRPDYELLFQAMIRDWRAIWNQGDFPFLYVQVSGLDTRRGYGWTSVRNAQLKTLKLPNTGMAVTVDISERDSHHPRNKLDVGKRLALAARAIAYGEKIEYSGPLYDSMSVQGNQAVVRFRHAASGLVIGSGPPIRLDQKRSESLEHLTGFEIAGGDGGFVTAQAKIEGDQVVVWSDEVSSPAHVRLGWSGYPEINLYNRDGLPASPFTSQDPPASE